MVELRLGYLARFIRMTAVLAMPAELQERWLATFSGGGHVDELALDWDGGWAAPRVPLLLSGPMLERTAQCAPSTSSPILRRLDAVDMRGQ